MTDITSTPPSFSIARTFLRDVSVEIANVPQTFLEIPPNPHFNLNIGIDSQKLESDNLFLTTLTTSLRATPSQDSNTTLFLIEVKFSGIFEIKGVPPQHIDSLLSVNAPAILLPHSRAITSLLLQQATLPSFILPEINFAAMLSQAQNQIQPANQPTLQ